MLYKLCLSIMPKYTVICQYVNLRTVSNMLRAYNVRRVNKFNFLNLKLYIVHTLSILEGGI